MIIWGGQGDSLTEIGGIYNPLTDTWTSFTITSPLSPFSEQNLSSTVIWTGTEVLLLGFPSDLNPYCIAYNPTTNTWRDNSYLPVSLGKTSAVFTGSKIIVNNAKLYYGKNYTTIYDINANSWSFLQTTNAPTYNINSDAVWTGTEMVGFGTNGGYVLGGTKTYNKDYYLFKKK